MTKIIAIGDIATRISIALSRSRDSIISLIECFSRVDLILQVKALEEFSKMAHLAFRVDKIKTYSQFCWWSSTSIDRILMLSSEYILSLPEPFIKRMFHRKCFMVLKVFRNIRRSYKF